MIHIKSFLFVLILLLPASIIVAQNKSVRERAIEAITKAENDFAKMAADKGIYTAFSFYAAPDATMRRGEDSLIFGKAGISNFYSDKLYQRAFLQWSPDFADASESGDMGYTYGKYTWQLKDESGKIIQEAKGIFHSVWKKQKDGAWKFVWD